MQEELAQASCITMYAVCQVTNTGLLWYNFTDGCWTQRPTHTLEYMLAYDASIAADYQANIIAVDIEGSNARYV